MNLLHQSIPDIKTALTQPIGLRGGTEGNTQIRVDKRTSQVESQIKEHGLERIFMLECCAILVPFYKYPYVGKSVYSTLSQTEMMLK